MWNTRNLFGSTLGPILNPLVGWRNEFRVLTSVCGIGAVLVLKNACSEDKGGGCFDDAPEQDWKYFVIAFSGTNQGVNLLEQSLVLLDSGPRIGFTIIAWGALGLHPGRFFQAMQERSFSLSANLIQGIILTVSTEQAVQIRQLADQLSAHPTAGIDVPRMTQQLLNLQTLDVNSDVSFLGYFSLLESLLVHKPDPKDPNDSITRQVRKRSPCWIPKLDYTAFDAANSESIWGKCTLCGALSPTEMPRIFKAVCRCLKTVRKQERFS